MNRTLRSRNPLFALGLAALLLLAAMAGAQTAPTAGKKNVPPSGIPANWKQIKTPPLPPFHPPQPVRLQLANGMVIFLQEDHELPLIDGTLVIRGGGRDVPAGKTGLAGIYSASWRTGGTQSKTGDELDNYLADRGAHVETSGDVDSTDLSWSCLKGDFNDVFAVVLDLLHNPEFRQDKIDLAKQQAATAISRRNDDINQITSREARKIAYGAANPYARVPEYYTLAAVTRQDLVAWHDANVHPNNVILGVVGDFDAKQMEAKLRQAFDSWPKGPEMHEARIDFPATQPGVYFAAKEDVNQSEIRMVSLGIERKDPDYYAVQVMNVILGEGFASRLFSNLRSKRGLAYSVGGGLSAAYDHPGVFAVGIGTKSRTTAEAAQGLVDELNKMKSDPPTDSEIQYGKDSLLNTFVFSLDSPDKVLRERMNYEFYGYPADTLERYRAGIEKVTRADVERVAKKYIHPEQMALLVVGKESDFDKPLSTFGKVTTLDITIPENAPGAPAAEAAPTASNPEGKALLAKVIEGLGGEAKVMSVKTLRVLSSVTLKTPQGDIALEGENQTQYPDNSFVRIKTPQGEQTRVVTPQAAFISFGGPATDMPAGQKAEILKTIHRDSIYVVQHAADPSFVFAAAGTEKIGDVQAAILDIDTGGNPFRWYIDPSTGHVLRAVFRTLTHSGPAEQANEFSDWKTVDGVTLPFKVSISQNGQVVTQVEVKEMQINPAIDPKIYQRPAGGPEK
ncbi:MAG TPA: pitrilysin family protein [Terriglobales bacterium]|jgi:zinc protease|nr:pitrilysin family protein [Terriglobales bacterium]